MKKSVLVASAVGMIALACCGGGKKGESADMAATDSVPTAQAAPEYRTLNLPTVDLAKFAKDKDGGLRCSTARRSMVGAVTDAKTCRLAGRSKTVVSR